MSTQHPDNVSNPFFASESVISGEDEIQEAYYVFSHLECDEQMWDCEGKEVDDFVVQKLLSRYERFFRENILGKDKFLTLRVPNPTVERTDAKVLIETLEGIPRGYDAAQLFYNEDIPPVFEVILPMTSSHRCLNRVYHYYKDMVVGKQDIKFPNDDKRIRDWIGDFRPEQINVIPLIEEKERMLTAEQIVGDYLADKQLEEQRVFLARSDPAMNYGIVSSVLLNKLALQHLEELAEKISTDIYPILGVGTAPFRGNFRPDNWKEMVRNYPSAQTFTIQSAFKFDFPEKQVREALEELKETGRGDATHIEEEMSRRIIEKSSKEYSHQISLIAPLVNNIADYIPARRKRKLHIGLFGYSRSVDEVRLPRAITFCSALYSVGLPPELLGLSCLSERELDFFRDADTAFDDDMRDAMQYYNPAVERLLPAELAGKLREDIIEFSPNERHLELTGQTINALGQGKMDEVRNLLIESAWIRRFLG